MYLLTFCLVALITPCKRRLRGRSHPRCVVLRNPHPPQPQPQVSPELLAENGAPQTLRPRDIPRQPQENPKMPQDGPKKAQKRFQNGSKTVQNSPKTALGRAKTAQDGTGRTRKTQTTPSEAQEPAKMPFQSDFSGQFGGHFWTVLVPKSGPNLVTFFDMFLLTFWAPKCGPNRPRELSRWPLEGPKTGQDELQQAMHQKLWRSEETVQKHCVLQRFWASEPSKIEPRTAQETLM